MPIYSERELPFPRGRCMSDGGIVTIGDTGFDYLEGRVFSVRDTVHSTGVPIHIMIVKNDSGAALTVERRCLKFSSTDDKDFGRRIAGWVSTAAKMCVPLDDAYTVGFSIPDDDLFYVVIRGWVLVKTEATTVDLHRGDAVTTDASGYLEGAQSGADDFILGTMDERTTATATAQRIFADIDLKMPYGS